MKNFSISRPSQKSVSPIGSPRRFAVIGWGACACFLGALVGWSAQAPIASAVVASGQLTVKSSRKIVQHLEGGSIEKIHVRDGDIVVAGQPLVEIDATEAKARLAATRHRVAGLLAQKARLVAERDEKPALRFPLYLVANDDDPRIEELLSRERDVFKARTRNVEGQVELLRQRAAILGQQISGLKGQIAAIDKQLVLIRDEHKGLKTLLEKGFAPKTRVLALQRAIARLAGERADLSAQVAQASKEIGETDLKVLQVRRSYYQSVVDELSAVEKQLAELREQETAAAAVAQRTLIKAPEAGVVVGLAVRTRGEVVRPGGKILEIVPDTDPLIVEAQIRPSDVDRVAMGQTGQVRLSALDQKTTPAVPARVTYLAADTLDTQNGREAFYKVEMELDPAVMRPLRSKNLKPGMPAEVFIHAGDRTLFEYIVQPLNDALARAMRE